MFSLELKYIYKKWWGGTRLRRQISIFIHVKFLTCDHAYAFIFLWADVYMRLPIGQESRDQFENKTHYFCLANGSRMYTSAHRKI